MNRTVLRKAACAVISAFLVLSLMAPSMALAEEATGTLTYRTDGDDDANYVDGDTSGQKSQWVKNGDVWTYTFYVDDPNAQWYVWEDSGTLMSGTYYLDSDGEIYSARSIGGMYLYYDKDGNSHVVGPSDVYEVSYSGDYTEYNPGTTFTTETLDSFNPDEYEGIEKSEDGGKTVYTWLDSSYSYKVTDNGDGTFTMVKTALSFTITNYSTAKPSTTPSPVYYGGLMVSKTVVGPDGSTNDDQTTTFTFDVTLTGEKISGVQDFGGIVFTSGIAKVKLKGGESITFTDIPEGTAYTVTEETAAGYKLISAGTLSGTIAKDVTAEAPFTNMREGGGSDPETVDVTVRKKVTGRYETAGSFLFRAALSALAPNASYQLSNGTAFTADASGSADISFELSDGESVSILGLPVGATYQISEEGAEDVTASYIVTDSGSGSGSIASSSGRAESAGSPLATKTETAESGEAVTVCFTNDIERTEDLVLKKVTTDPEDTAAYTFLVTFGNLNEGESFYSSLGKLTAGSDGRVSVETELANGGTAEFYGLPVGTTYTITEYASASVASFAIVDANGGTRIVKSSGANSTALSPLSTAEETVNEGEAATVTFTNDSTESEPDSVSVQPVVSKVVLDSSGERTYSDETFAFTIEADDEAYPMPSKTEAEIIGVSEAKNPATGEYVSASAGFGTITFTEAGTYSYTVREKEGDGPYKYDASVYTVKYEVIKEDGLLKAYTSIYKNSVLVKNAASAEFTNTETSVPTNLEIAKQVAGNMGDREEYFKFTVRLAGLKRGGSYAVDLSGADLVTEVTSANAESYRNTKDLGAADSEGHGLTYDSASGSWYYVNEEGEAVAAEPAGYAIAAGSDGTAEAVFYLKHGQKVRVIGVPTGCSYEIFEDAKAMHEEGYETSAKAAGDTVTGDGTEAEEAIGLDSESLSMADSCLTADTTVTYTNTRGTQIETGIAAAVWPAVGITAAGLFGFLFFVWKRRKKDEEKA